MNEHEIVLELIPHLEVNKPELFLSMSIYSLLRMYFCLVYCF